MNQQPNSEEVLESDVPLVKDITMTDEHEFGNGLLPYYAKKKWIDGREAFIEFYFKMSHTIFFTLFLIFNSVVALSSLLLYFNQFIGAEIGIESLRTLLPTKLEFIASVLSLIYIPLDQHPLFWLGTLFFVYFSWCYSTITQPIKDKKGRKTYINYVSPKGRKGVFIVTLIQIYFIYSGLFAWYMKDLTFEFFRKVQVTDKPYLKITSLEGLSNILNIVPIVICLVTAFLIIREFYKTPDIKDTFLEWTFGLLSKQSYTLRGGECDVIVGYEKDTDKPIILVEIARYLHTLIVGSTGTGKSSTQLLPVIAQDLIRLARGKKLGVVVLEPKGDLIRDVESIAKELKIDESLIKIIDPTDKNSKLKINPLAGPMDTAANLWAGTLDALSGDQDKFFKDQQSEVATNYVMLGKIRYGESFHFIYHLQQMYSDARFLANMVQEVRTWLNVTMKDDSLTYEERTVLQNYNLICEYFEMDVLEYVVRNDKEGPQPVLYPLGHKHAGKQVVTNKKDKFIAGAKKYVNDISLNPLLSNLFIAREGDLFVDIDDFLDKGGVLLFNSALGELEELSLIFGQFVIRQFQSSVFRRPPQKDGYKRIPVFFNVDEFPLYINEAFERLLTLGRSYLVGTTTAVQSLGQIAMVKQGFERTIIGNSNNKFVFGRGELTDNKYFSEHFGEDYVLDESSNESTTPFSMPDQSIGVRHNVARTLQPRFTPTMIKELKFKHYIAEIVDAEGSIMKPVHAYGLFLSETNFLKKFANIGNIELKTKDYKPLNFKGNIKQLKYLVNSLETEHVAEQMVETIANNEDVSQEASHKQGTEQHELVNTAATHVENTPILEEQDQLPLIIDEQKDTFVTAKSTSIEVDLSQSNVEAPAATPAPTVVENIEGKADLSEEDDEVLFWPDDEENTEPVLITEQQPYESDKAESITITGEINHHNSYEDSTNVQYNPNISEPTNINSIINSLEKELGSAIKPAPKSTDETKNTSTSVATNKPIEHQTKIDEQSSSDVEAGTQSADNDNSSLLSEIDDQFSDIFALAATDRNVNRAEEQSKSHESSSEIDSKGQVITPILHAKDDL